MMTYTKRLEITLGEYINRKVNLFLSGNNELPERELTNALVLAFFEGGAAEPDPRHCLYSMVTQEPLGISVCGERSEEHFDSLLEILSRLPTRHHINTGVFHANSFYDCAIDFLESAMPPPEQFDQWERYVLMYFWGPLFGGQEIEIEIDRLAEWLKPF